MDSSPKKSICKLCRSKGSPCHFHKGIATVKTLSPPKDVSSEWVKLKDLGEGSYGKVYKAKRKGDSDDTWFAVKVGKTANLDLKEEIKIHSTLVHPSIVRYVKSFEMDECGGKKIVEVPIGTGVCNALVLEYLEGKTVKELVEAKGMLSETLIARLAKQMATALLYLQEHHVVHCDIKPANILSDRQNNFKLADFGLAEISGQKSKIQKGAPLYMAPEILTDALGPYYFNHKTDIWAFGIVMFYAFHGDVPWSTKTNLYILKAEVRKGIIPRIGMAEEPQDFHNFLNGCLKWNPEERFTPQNCIANEFFREYKSPRDTKEEEKFASDFKEFSSDFVQAGEDIRTAFYIWLSRKYMSEPQRSFIRFNELYDGLYLE